MLKIAVISPRFSNAFSGGETYIKALAQHLSETNEVHLITSSEDKYCIQPKYLKMHYIDGLRSSRLSIYTAVPQLIRTLKHIQPNLVHLHCFMSAHVYIAACSAGEYNTVITVHSTPCITPDGRGHLFAWLSESQLAEQIQFLRLQFERIRYQAVFFGSQYYMNQYTEAIPEIKTYSPCYVNSYFSSIGDIEPQNRPQLKKNTNEQIRILFPSRITRRKGIEETLRLMTMLPDNYFLDLPAIAQDEGDGYTETIRQKIENMDLKNRVIMPESVIQPKNMFAHYMASDIVIIPSYYEGFGIVAVEAMDCCTPVATTCAGGLGEIIQDDFNGIKIDLNDMESAKNKIIRLVEDNSLREKLVKNAKNTITEKYTAQRHWNLLDNIYRNILNKKDGK